MEVVLHHSETIRSQAWTGTASQDGILDITLSATVDGRDEDELCRWITHAATSVEPRRAGLVATVAAPEGHRTHDDTFLAQMVVAAMSLASGQTMAAVTSVQDALSWQSPRGRAGGGRA